MKKRCSRFIPTLTYTNTIYNTHTPYTIQYTHSMFPTPMINLFPRSLSFSTLKGFCVGGVHGLNGEFN